MPTFCNNLARDDIAIGIVSINGVSEAVCPSALTGLLDTLAKQVGHFSDMYGSRRKAVRNMLRNGSYKPSGRGKPASEYLIRMIGEGEPLPDINPVVNIFNYLSARYQLPISVWNVDIGSGDSVVFDLGKADDSYPFNASGHIIKLHDLLAGFIEDQDGMKPAISPVKDAHAVKVASATNRVAAAFYIPSSELSEIDDIMGVVLALLQEASPQCSVEVGLLQSGQTITFNHTS